MKGFGIHIGNTTCCIAYIKDDKLDVLPNDAGDRTTPSMITYLENEMNVGLPAKQRAARFPRSTMTNMKSLFTTRQDSELVPPIIVENFTVGFQLVVGEDKHLFVSVDKGIEILFQKMYEIATHFAGGSEKEYPCCIAVPLGWSIDDRRRMKKCAEKAGFRVLQTASESATSLLAYKIGDIVPNCTCLIYRCGGSTLDVSLVRVSNGLYSVKSSVSKNEGGDQLTKILANFLADEFRQRYKLDPRESKRSFGKLLSVAEQSKHVLSTMSSSHVFVESLCEGVDFSTNVSRARFEMLVQIHISRLCSPIQECIEKGGCTADAIDKLIIVGGSLRMPGFQQAVKDRLPNAELLSSVSPDEVISVGAAKQAAIMADIGLTDVLNSAVPVSCLPEKISLKMRSKLTNEEAIKIIFDEESDINYEESDVDLTIDEEEG